MKRFIEQSANSFPFPFSRQVVWMVAVLAMVLTGCKPDPQLGTETVDEVVNALTLEEKVHLLVGTGTDDCPDNPSGHLSPGAVTYTTAIPRLNIPDIKLAADIAVSRDTTNDSATLFPMATALASTWNQTLVRQVGQAVGDEALHRGVDVLLTPSADVLRNPLYGRSFECYSEDPFLSGRMAVAYVQGIQDYGVGAAVRHLGVTGQESNRAHNDVRVSQRALREIYLKSMEMVVKEAQPWAMMVSCNPLNGTCASESQELLTALLRDEWGFRGVTLSDWFGGRHAATQTKAGNDLLLPGTEQQCTDMLAGLKDGRLTETELDRNARRVLKLVLRTPRFRNAGRTDSLTGQTGHVALARRTAAESVVLLKNAAGTLPLDSTIRRVSLFGCASYAVPYAADANHTGSVSLQQGLADAGIVTGDSLLKFYHEYMSASTENRLPREPLPSADRLLREADASDAALVTLSRVPGRSGDRGIGDFFLRKEERQLIDTVCAAFHTVGKKVIVVLAVDGVVETATWKEKPDAILCAWLGGQESGHGLADVLGGQETPSGKLPVTFPVRLEDAPSSENFPIAAMRRENGNLQKKDWDYTSYEEDVYVGYRYFDSFDSEVSYPFGYGLSYTEFSYSEPSIRISGDTCMVSVRVKNTGTRPGREVAQLYVTAPDAGRNNKPEKELKAFAKTQVLQPGEEEMLELSVPIASLASFDAAASAWKVDGGVYTFLWGSSSRDIRSTLQAEMPALTTPAGNLLRPQTGMRLLRR